MIKKLIRYLDRKLLFNLLYTIYLKILIYKSKLFLKNYLYLKIQEPILINNKFSELCEKFITDKGGLSKNSNKRSFHFYSSFYHEYFNNDKENIKLIFECGIGSSNKNIKSNIFGKNSPGASLKVLKNYFSNAEIYGGDIDKKTFFTENRINTLYVDQLNTDSILDMWAKIGKRDFDLIIDDGMHTLDASYNFFKYSFENLKYDGLYIIEDVHIAYLKKLIKKLSKFKPLIVTTHKENNIDDFLLIIKKTRS